MKLTIDLSEEEYSAIHRLAQYVGATDARIVEALLLGQAEGSYLAAEGDLNWMHLVDYLRENGEGSPERLALIERYVTAVQAAASRQALMDFSKSWNSGQFDSLTDFEMWEKAGLDMAAMHLGSF